MKKTLLVALAVLGLGVASSKADVAFSVSFGNRYCPPVYRAPVCAPAPVYVAPAPVYVTPAPVYAPAPVYVAPAPVYAPVYRPVYAPVCPTPVVVHSGYRHHGYSHHRSYHGHGSSHGSIRIGW